MTDNKALADRLIEKADDVAADGYGIEALLREAAAALTPPQVCQCEACRHGTAHASDCATHNAPAMPKGACDYISPPQADMARGEAVAWTVCDSKGIRFTLYNRELADAIAERGLLVLPMFGCYEWLDVKADAWKPINRLPYTWERELGIQWRERTTPQPQGDASPEDQLLTRYKAAWDTVCDALDEVDPDWMMHGPVGADAAVALIRKFAALSAKPRQEDIDSLIDGSRKTALEIQHNKESWFPMTDRRMKRVIRYLSGHFAVKPASAPVGVERLVAEWRDKSQRLKGHPNCDEVVLAMADELARCADDLGALAQQPAVEVIATRDEDGEIIRVTQGDRVIASTCHAGGKQPAAVGVDEVVEIVAEYLCIRHDLNALAQPQGEG